MPPISLILAGAVSLGSFEAGVLDELLYVLDRLNRGRPGRDRYVIDGIAGASAGSMTGALVAQAVMRGFGKRRLLHEAWVEQIDIRHLVRDTPPNALLSKAAVAEIGAAFLPYRTPTSPASPDGPSSLAAPTLRLAFTVTNLTGVDYRLARSSAPGVAATFESTFHAERREFELRRDAPESDPWDDIREAAIASGTFPLAFTAHPLPALASAWPGHALAAFPESFWYVDGGVFNNEPVGVAVRLARKTDDPAAGARLDPDRIFVLVDANLNRATSDATFSDDAALVLTARRLVGAVLAETTANDWLRALRRNNEVDWRDAMVGTMATLVGEMRVDDPAVFVRQLEAAGERVAARKRELLGERRYPTDYRQSAVDRLLEQYRAHTDGWGPDQRRIFGNLVFLLNSVAGLDRKRKLNLHMIHSEGAEVAGDALHAFAGFFRREWRQHDYTVGRAKARAALPTILGLTHAELPEPEPGVAYVPDVDLRDVTMAHAPRSAREALRDATLLKVKAATRDVRLGPRWAAWALSPPARWLIGRVARKRLETLLEL